MSDPLNRPDVPDLWPDEPEQVEVPADGDGPIKPLLHSSVVLLIAGSIILFLAAVATGNAPPNSPVERIGGAIHRLSMVAMLISFFGILAAYRLPSIAAAAQRARRERDSNGDSAGVIRMNQSSGVGPWAIIVVVGCGLLWLTQCAGLFWLSHLSVFLLAVTAGPMAVAAWMLGGTFRWFVVGTLVSFLFLRSSGSVMTGLSIAVNGEPSFFVDPWSGQGFQRALAFNNSIVLTAALFSGLLSAWLAHQLEHRNLPVEPEIETGAETVD